MRRYATVPSSLLEHLFDEQFMVRNVMRRNFITLIENSIETKTENIYFKNLFIN
jgi:hypothetical protein